ncbi:MAG: hypothetical protein FWB78_12495 [Treponema sp.]|nr:hypothetical protein [Treponema sp.]
MNAIFSGGLDGERHFFASVFGLLLEFAMTQTGEDGTTLSVSLFGSEVCATLRLVRNPCKSVKTIR